MSTTLMTPDERQALIERAQKLCVDWRYDEDGRSRLATSIIRELLAALIAGAPREKDFSVNDVVKILGNVGIDTECGACMEIAFTSTTTNQHDCTSPAPQGLIAQWQPIASFHSNDAALFWVVPKMPEESYCDTAGNSIFIPSQEGRIMRGKYRTWSSLEKATHWMPLPLPPGGPSR